MKEIFKLNLKRNSSKYIKYGTIILSIVAFIFVFVYLTKADFNVTQEFKVIDSTVDNFDSDYMISAYIDDVKQDNFPSPNDNVKFKSVVCNKEGAVASFDEGEWKTYISTNSKNTRCSVYFETDNEAWKLPGGVDLETGMLPIVFDGDTIKVADTTSKWYDYRNGQWANAALVVASARSKSAGQTLSLDEILQMYVWIPRYAYKVWPKENNQSNEQIINIVFESSTKKDSAIGYITHPAFKFGATELNGFWVGKFEPSYMNSSYTNIICSTANCLSCTDENCANANYIRIMPNRMSLTNNNVSNYYFASRSISRSGNTFGINNATTNTRMMKNTEWGAVAYLTQSRYGLYNYNGTCKNENQATSNGCEVFINNINVGYGNDATHDVSWQWGPTVTGCSAQSVDATEGYVNTHNQTNPTCSSSYAWNQNGVLASTTGNKTGIYDMSGGSWEYVMGNVSSDQTKYVFLNSYAGFDASFVPEDKYCDKYVGTNGDIYTDQSRGILGDATIEIMKNYGNYTGAWNFDYAYFATTSHPWFKRGGFASHGEHAGVFTFGRDIGNANSYYSFRIVLSRE